MHYPYVILGGGLAGASAIEGIRAHDPDGPILMVSRENHPPYHRPLLSKDLWFGRKTKDDLPVHPKAFYEENGVELLLRREIVEVDAKQHTVWDDRGTAYEYEKLLFATGGRPMRLDVYGAEVESVRYFRALEDYLALEAKLERLQHVLVVGGGFIGLELAAALCHAGKEVTLVYPHEYPLHRVLPRDLGLFVADYYRQQGVETVSNERIIEFEDHNELTLARTGLGNVITTQLVLVGIGIHPHVGLAEATGIEVDSGIEVDEYTRTSMPDVFAAGDVAEFPCLPLQIRMTCEHWDHAKHHGRCAGVNMAGVRQAYDAIPMFYSDFFDLGWEAVGEVTTDLEVEAHWKEPMREGVIFYLRDDVVRGVLMWNVWDKVEWARDLLREGKATSRDAREALIQAAV